MKTDGKHHHKIVQTEPRSTVKLQAAVARPQKKTHIAAVLDKLELREYARSTSDHSVNLDKRVQVNLSQRSLGAGGGGDWSYHAPKTAGTVTGKK